MRLFVVESGIFRLSENHLSMLKNVQNIMNSSQQTQAVKHHCTTILINGKYIFGETFLVAFVMMKDKSAAKNQIKRV